jgi:ABC-2 type transport system permease protein
MNSWIIASLIIRRTIGNRKGFLILVLLPIIVISGIVGMFGKVSDEQAQIAVWNEDQSWLSQPIVDSVRAISSYQVHMQDPSKSTIEALKQDVYNGKWDAAIYIPNGYTQKLLAGEETAIDLFRKTEQLWNASLRITLMEETERLSRSIQMVTASDSNPQTQEQLIRDLLAKQDTGGVEVVKDRLVKHHDNAFVLGIGIMLMFLMILVNQSIQGVMEDRSNRTMARIFAAPIRAWEIAAGNFLGCLLLGTLQLVLILVFTRFVIGFDFGITFGKLVVILAFFLLAAVGVSSAVAGLIKNSALLGNVNNLVVIPTCMLGGCFWPVSMMPDFMQKLSNFTPQRWAIVALEQASAGASLTELGLELGILVLFAAVLLAFGSYILQPARN